MAPTGIGAIPSREWRGGESGAIPATPQSGFPATPSPCGKTQNLLERANTWQPFATQGSLLRATLIVGAGESGSAGPPSGGPFPCATAQPSKH
jgi:hypothetical protein